MPAFFVCHCDPEGEAIQKATREALDCFASLAMTGLRPKHALEDRVDVFQMVAQIKQLFELLVRQGF